jgi:hypothetical protein
MRLAHFEAFHIPSQASKPTVQWFLKPEWFALAAPRALTACSFAVFQEFRFDVCNQEGTRDFTAIFRW